METLLMLGNEVVARGAWEAGVQVAAAYPGTPSTEIVTNAMVTIAESDKAAERRGRRTRPVTLRTGAGDVAAGSPAWTPPPRSSTIESACTA